LRRAALGVIRLIVENRLSLPLTKVFQAAQKLYPDLQAEPVAPALLDFFADRLKVALKDKGVRHDLISAVFARTQQEVAEEFGVAGDVDLVRILARVKALQDFLETEEGADLLVAYRRAANIVRIEEKKDSKVYAGVPDERRLEAEEEIALHGTLEKLRYETEQAIQAENFVEAMTELARLRAPVDDFFDNVMVNCDSAPLRDNRLRLLAFIQSNMDQIADFSRIEG
jgi:glycyl-tRNA synthetase beta chain